MDFVLQLLVAVILLPIYQTWSLEVDETRKMFIESFYRPTSKKPLGRVSVIAARHGFSPEEEQIYNYEDKADIARLIRKREEPVEWLTKWNEHEDKKHNKEKQQTLNSSMTEESRSPYKDTNLEKLPQNKSLDKIHIKGNLSAEDIKSNDKTKYNEHDHHESQEKKSQAIFSFATDVTLPKYKQDKEKTAENQIKTQNSFSWSKVTNYDGNDYNETQPTYQLHPHTTASFVTVKLFLKIENLGKDNYTSISNQERKKSVWLSKWDKDDHDEPLQTKLLTTVSLIRPESPPQDKNHTILDSKSYLSKMDKKSNWLTQRNLQKQIEPAKVEVQITDSTATDSTVTANYVHQKNCTGKIVVKGLRSEEEDKPDWLNKLNQLQAKPSTTDNFDFGKSLLLNTRKHRSEVNGNWSELEKTLEPVYKNNNSKKQKAKSNTHQVDKNSHGLNKWDQHNQTLQAKLRATNSSETSQSFSLGKQKEKVEIYKNSYESDEKTIGELSKIKMRTPDLILSDKLLHENNNTDKPEVKPIFNKANQEYNLLKKWDQAHSDEQVKKKLQTTDLFFKHLFLSLNNRSDKLGSQSSQGEIEKKSNSLTKADQCDSYEPEQAKIPIIDALELDDSLHNKQYENLEVDSNSSKPVKKFIWMIKFHQNEPIQAEVFTTVSFVANESSPQHNDQNKLESKDNDLSKIEKKFSWLTKCGRCCNDNQSGESKSETPILYVTNETNFSSKKRNNGTASNNFNRSYYPIKAKPINSNNQSTITKPINTTKSTNQSTAFVPMQYKTHVHVASTKTVDHLNIHQSLPSTNIEEDESDFLSNDGLNKHGVIIKTTLSEVSSLIPNKKDINCIFQNHQHTDTNATRITYRISSPPTFEPRVDEGYTTATHEEYMGNHFGIEK